MLAAAMALPIAAQAKVEITPAVGFGKTYVAGSWVPVRALVENGPDPKRPERKVLDHRGQVRVTIMDREGKTVRYVQPLELAKNSKKLLEFEVMIPENPAPMRVDMLDEKGRELARVEVDLGWQSGANQRDRFLVVPTVLLETDPNESVSLPCWVTRSANVQRIAIEALPSELRGYDGVRLLVVRRRISNRLDEARQKALEDWLMMGGQLAVVASRFQDEIKLDTWLKDRMPAPIDSVREAEMGELSPGASSEKVLIAAWGPMRPETRTLIDSPLGPIALERKIGARRILALGLDPSAIPGEALSSPLGLQMQQLIESLILAPELEDVRTRHYWTTANIAEKFEGVSVLPNKWIVAFLLAVFVAVVGPGNFWFLRKHRRLELAWVTIPTLSGFFFVAVYAYGLVAKGGQQFVASSEILHLRSGGSRGPLYWTASQFSPAATGYSAKVEGDGIVLPLLHYFDIPKSTFNQFLGNKPSLTTQEGKPAIATLKRGGGIDLVNPVEQWMMAFYQGERMIDIAGTIEGKVTLMPDGSARAKIENKTDAALKRPTLFIGERRFQLPDLDAGKSFDGPLDGSARHPAWPSKTEAFYRDAADKIRDGIADAFPVMQHQKPQHRCRLVAIQEKWTSGMKIEPQPDHTKTCAMIEVDLPLEAEGEVELSTTPLTQSDSLRLEIYDFDRQNTSFFDYETQFCSLNESWMEALIGAPELAGEARAIGAEVAIHFTGSVAAFNVMAFNYSKGLWEPVKDPDQRIPEQPMDRKMTFSLGPDMLNPFGRHARLRLESKQPPATQQRPQGMFGRENIMIGKIDAKMRIAGAAGQAAVQASAPAGEQAPPSL